jgi:hypothetical protein
MLLGQFGGPTGESDIIVVEGDIVSPVMLLTFYMYQINGCAPVNEETSSNTIFTRIVLQGLHNHYLLILSAFDMLCLENSLLIS